MSTFSQAAAQDELNQNGFVVIDDLNIETDKDYIDFGTKFGHPMSQYSAGKVWNLKPLPEMKDLYHSRNQHMLFPHTECYESEGLPPKYLVLRCIKPADCGGGKTLLYDAKPYFAEQPDEIIEHLVQNKVLYKTASGIAKTTPMEAWHPLLEPSGLLRFSCNNMAEGSDEVIDKVVEDLLNLFEKGKIEITWSEGRVLIWDNWRMLHNRTAYQDSERELHRLWLQ